MNKDRVEGKVKDVAGRVERQAGEWTGDPEKQVEGAAKQVAGKIQNAWGKTKDASKTNPPSKPPTQLYVDPNGCIDCGACAPVCTSDSIRPLDELPEELKSFAEKNAAFYSN